MFKCNISNPLYFKLLKEKNAKDQRTEDKPEFNALRNTKLHYSGIHRIGKATPKSPKIRVSLWWIHTIILEETG